MLMRSSAVEKPLASLGLGNYQILLPFQPSLVCLGFLPALALTSQENPMTCRFLPAFVLLVLPLLGRAEEPSRPADKLAVGDKAPEFKIKDASGKVIDLAELTAKGPVLLRLTCGCSGCDKELAYFQAIHEAYKGKGLTILAVCKEPDDKVAKYVKEKKLNMLYADETK